MEAHLLVNLLERPPPVFPFLTLLISGGHCLLIKATDIGKYEILGQTRDDAVGEAFDKVAKLLGLNYPGGPEIERVAEHGKTGRFSLPRPMLSSRDHPSDAAYFDMSFSGLKTAAAMLASELEQNGGLDGLVPDLAAEFQEAVIDVLVEKTMRAVKFTNCHRVVLGGGVARNSRLRNCLSKRLADGGGFGIIS